MYLAITRLSLASVGQIARESKVRREDVYRTIPKLERLGLTERILGNPVKIRATPLEEALSSLIKREEDEARKKTMRLKNRKEAFLKHFKARGPKSTSPSSEDARFALISHKDQILNKGLNMISSTRKETNMITSISELSRVINDHGDSFKVPLRRGAIIKVVLDMPESFEPIRRILEPKLHLFTSLKGSLQIKYSNEPLGHYLITDFKEAMIATSTHGRFAENPYLWTNDENMVGLMQTNFEEMWQASVSANAIHTRELSEKVGQFVEELRPRDHVIFVYESQEAKHNVLFHYLKAGLEIGEVAAYVVSEETQSQIREEMKRFGIAVEKYEKADALKIFSYKDIYIINGKFDVKTTMDKWSKLHDAALASGFKGLRVTGEMACFFEHNLVEQLVEYERSLHRVLELPMMAICAYSAQTLTKVKNPINLYTELVRAHGAVLFAGVDQELGRIEIRKA